MSNLPIQFTDKVNSPELLAIMQQFGEHTYVDAELINKFRDAINELHNSLNPDRIISLGTETISGNQRTYEGYKWQINGVEVDNIGNPIQLNFPSATVGYKRNDISVFKADGTIERIAGIETDGDIVSPPDVPEGTLYFKTYSIDGDAVESEPEPTVIDGSIFKKKSENSSLKITATGEEQIINLSLGGQMHYIVTSSALISVAGFSPHLLNMGGNALYPGQDLIFENQTGNPVTLINAHAIAPIKFNEGADIIVPNGGKIWFRINEEFANVMMKSWSDVKDVIEGYFNGTNFYIDAGFTNLITPESGKIYVNILLTPSTQYRWSGLAYKEIGSGEKYKEYFQSLYSRQSNTATNTWRSWMVSYNGTSFWNSPENIALGTDTLPTFNNYLYGIVSHKEEVKKLEYILWEEAYGDPYTKQIIIKKYDHALTLGQNGVNERIILNTTISCIPYEPFRYKLIINDFDDTPDNFTSKYVLIIKDISGNGFSTRTIRWVFSKR